MAIVAKKTMLTAAVAVSALAATGIVSTEGQSPSAPERKPSVTLSAPNLSAIATPNSLYASVGRAACRRRANGRCIDRTRGRAAGRSCGHDHYR